MFIIPTESLLSRGIVNIDIYLRNAHTHNSLQANYECGLSEL